jgi:nucleotide-binding universal stress UspA family protein
MGTRGQGSATAALLGSVAQGVIAATGIPILLVK